MTTSNHERVGTALNLLRDALAPFVEREMAAVHGERWRAKAIESLRKADIVDGELHVDAHALLVIMWDNWHDVFRNTLGFAERSLVSELREVRNAWAHQKPFTLDDTYRALDSVHRLLTAISAPEAAEVDRQKQEILRRRFDEQAKREAVRATTARIEGQPTGGLKPWREIVTPHPDVASGRYQQAEFAADLGQVHRGEGSAEYADPREFFRRTFLTEGLARLLVGAVQRLAGTGGDPVVELQTNFGGGKTHSMLALYHLFSDVPPSELAGVDAVLRSAGVTAVEPVRRAVLVGTAISPARPRPKGKEIEIRTLWGDLAWQLAGPTGYALVAQPDREAVNPGSDALRELFRRAGPTLVLIDEFVAYVRQLYGKSGLPGGSFDANMTFVQSLTEAASATPHVLVVASLPSSDIEIGGEGGREALVRLKNVFGRVESAWRPASAEEGFEIVRRRLFEPIGDAALFTARDVVVRAFMDQYNANPTEFPLATRESDYARRLTAAYPIHPELFDRLYNDWSSLDKFQRTRGVLRLMSAVIHALWEREDRSLLILPAGVPIDDPAVQFELTRYLEDPWTPVIEKDVDGPYSLPLELDRAHPNLGRYSACRRMARTLYLGSAPTLHTALHGADERQLKLGSVQPGEAIATFGDALRRLTDKSTHLYYDGQRYWYSTQPSVNRLAQDRAEQLAADDVEMEILKRLQQVARQRGEFHAVHVAPASSGEVPDEREARLVVLGPAHPHSARATDSAALGEAAAILDRRGNSPRLFRNTLAFLAADANRLYELEQGVRGFLAWRSIEEERETLGLDPFQARQAATKRADQDEAVVQRLPETYAWLIVPSQGRDGGGGNVTWHEYRLQGQDGLAVRAARKLIGEEMLVTQMAGTRLKMEIDAVPLWQGEGDHIAVRQLADYFAQYLYLPRPRDPDVLREAIQDGVRLLTWEQDSFAYADRWDEEAQRYVALRAGEAIGVQMQGDAVVVRAEAARRQRAADVVVATAAGEGGGASAEGAEGSEGPTGGLPGREDGPLPTPRPGRGATPRTEEAIAPRRFYGAVALDPTRVGTSAGEIGDEVVKHLVALLGADVNVTLEIEAKVPEGAPDHVVRTVKENCRTLKFSAYGFEEE